MMCTSWLNHKNLRYLCSSSHPVQTLVDLLQGSGLLELLGVEGRFLPVLN